jgi:hypothetical protein
LITTHQASSAFCLDHEPSRAALNGLQVHLTAVAEVVRGVQFGKRFLGFGRHLFDIAGKGQKLCHAGVDFFPFVFLHHRRAPVYKPKCNKKRACPHQ